MQMGVSVDCINNPFEAEITEVEGLISPEAGDISGNNRFGYVLSHKPNASVKAVNRLLKKGEEIYWTTESFREGGRTHPAGSILIKNGESTRQDLEAMAEEYGLDFHGLRQNPSVDQHRVQRPKVGLYKSWVANMDEGWTRWILNEYHFEVDTLHDADLTGRDLSGYHAIIIPDQYPSRILNGHKAGTMPEKYTGGMGIEGTLALQKFVEGGGTLLAFDSASDFVIDQFGLPVDNVVSGLSNTRFFIPGSLIRATVDTESPLAFGMQPEIAASFSRSRAFKTIQIDREGEGGKEDIKKTDPPPISVPVRYAEEDLLMSGWALGEQRYLSDKAAMMNVRYGDGNIVLYAFRPQFRGQPRGTYKLIFNALYMSTMETKLIDFETTLRIPPEKVEK